MHNLLEEYLHSRYCEEATRLFNRLTIGDVNGKAEELLLDGNVVARHVRGGGGYELVEGRASEELGNLFGEAQDEFEETPMGK